MRHTPATETTYLSKALAEFLLQHPKVMILTGAGISTSSGIPAYRDENGNWKASQPIQHKIFISDELARKRYWARALPGWETIRQAQPSKAHHAIEQLNKMGKITQIVTQNVDRLHQQAGSTLTIDLHGRSDRVKCISCGHDYCRIDIHQQAKHLNPQFANLSAEPAADGDAHLEADLEAFNVPQCAQCGGILKPDVVYFGDNVPKQRVESALSALKASDALLAIGSSLMVYSGFRFCKRAKEWEIPIAILNQGATRADDICALKLEGDINQVMTEAISLLYKQ